ncbi:MAG: preprotein translocase subunit SecY [Hadesarchaea archaeon]|nr:preprotein translocase subunit SecY [Hadesarchaea archaeon]
MEQPERPRSKLYTLEPLVRKLPEVAVPKRHVSFKEKFMWTGIALIAFFVLTQVPLYGMAPGAGRVPFFGQLRFILASHGGSLMELGIGPIVTAGIIMQLLVGSKILGLNLSQSEDRALFTGVQKIGAMVMGIFQASMLVIAGTYGVALGSNAGIFIVVQLAIAVIIVIYLDELVSKYGFGSGISLFIVAGVSMTIFAQAFNPIATAETGGEIAGAIPNLIKTLIMGGNISDAFIRPWPLPNMMGVIATILVFFIVVYVESMRIEIPLAYGRFGGIRGRYPIKFMYTSVIPVILAMVVLANIRILGMFFSPLQGVSNYLSTPNGIFAVVADPLRAVIYLVVLVLLCMGFAWMWVNMTGMGPRNVAEQLDRSGMLIPGFRRDIRVMERVLSRYITGVTLLGGATVALLSAGADFMGALGSGTGILLAVSIMYSLYQEIARERVTEMFPAMRRFFGE